MHLVQFDKGYAQQVFDAIKAGQSLPAPPGGWTGHGMLLAAGILTTGVMTQGPQDLAARGKTLADLKKLHPEIREHEDHQFTKDVLLGVEFVTVAGMQVLEGQYDEHFEPQFQAIVYKGADGEQGLIPLTGFNGMSGDTVADDENRAG